MAASVGTPWLWAGFVAVVVFLVALDLGVFHREDRVVSAREALAWTGIWVTSALLFDGVVWWMFGPAKAVDFLTGYLIEESLSVDNLFVFVVVFGSLGIPPRVQHRVLFWGILTAIVLRAALIVSGTALVVRFGWLLPVLGAFLVLAGVRVFFHREKEHHPERSIAFRLFRRLVPSTSRMEGHAFAVREAGRWVATPLLLALVLVETSDVVFALDSIPAIFGVTLDPFIVFTSNVFAILGLRSLYFAVARLIARFEYLKVGIALVLVFVGAKMLSARIVHVSSPASLAIVATLLGGSTAYSLVRTRRARSREQAQAQSRGDRSTSMSRASALPGSGR
jgi:tellurite resistance protein TerC